MATAYAYADLAGDTEAATLLSRLAELATRRLAERSPVTCADDVMVLLGDMAKLETEELRAILLDTRTRPLDIVTVCQGSVDSAPIRVADIFREAIRQNAPALIIAHNHPSGDPSPSAEDITITRCIVEAGRLLDIKVLDHVVIAAGKHVSLAASGLLQAARN